MLFRSRLIDRVRRKAAQGRMLEKVADQTGGPKDDENAISSLARSEDCATVRRVLATLKPGQRELLELAFFSGMTHLQIAEATGKPLGTVKTTIRRALLELRECLAKEGYEL
jgi:RNA polymerase sigma-70 factor (ECF subfamily)